MKGKSVSTIPGGRDYDYLFADEYSDDESSDELYDKEIDWDYDARVLSINRDEIPNLVSSEDLYPGITIRELYTENGGGAYDYLVIGQVVPYKDLPDFWGGSSNGDASVIEVRSLRSGHENWSFLSDLGIEPDAHQFLSPTHATALLYTVILPE